MERERVFLTLVHNSRVQLDSDGCADDLAQEAGGVARFGDGAVGGGVGCGAHDVL